MVLGDPSPSIGHNPAVMGASEYDRAVELIHDGAALHYAAGADDEALLRGDQLYAQGLARLAELGELDAIARLADVISQVAQAHVEGDPARAEAAWEAFRRS
jgi:hypothetical protein